MNQSETKRYFAFDQVLFDGLQEHRIPSVIELGEEFEMPYTLEQLIALVVAEDDGHESYSSGTLITPNHLSIKVERVTSITEDMYNQFSKVFSSNTFSHTEQNVNGLNFDHEE